MGKYIQMFRELAQTEQGQQFIVEMFFNEYVGIGENYLDIVEIKGKKYISNTESMELCNFDYFIENEILDNVNNYADFITKVCNINILNNAMNLLNNIIINMCDLVNLYEMNDISSELLNGIEGYPQNWKSLDEELAKLEDFRDNIKNKINEVE